MPDLPANFRRRYRQLGLPAADVLVLADELPTAQYFDSVLAAGAAAKPAANWIMGDIMAFCKVSLEGFAVFTFPFNIVRCSIQVCSMAFMLFVLQSSGLVSISAACQVKEAFIPDCLSRSDCL